MISQPRLRLERFVGARIQMLTYSRVRSALNPHAAATSSLIQGSEIILSHE